MSISTASILVELNISVWTASKLDRGATQDVTNGAKAVASAAKVHKNLMAGTGKRKEIADYAASCRLWHMKHTLPWSDKGARLLPTSLLLEYRAQMSKMEDRFNAMVRDFIAEYPVLVGQAQSNLGDLFDVDDYPPAQDVANKFGFRFVYSPLPDAGDFRIDLPSQELQEIKDQYEAAQNDRVNEAMRSAWEQLHTMLSGIAEKLTDTDEGKRYHETLVTNAQTLCGLLSHLNVTGDPALETARAKLERAMAGVDITDIRESADVRQAVKADVESILKSFDW
ncbi:MAG: hypothetical protein DDT36_01272 [Firmicutes bacterium]|nr:hypothetical protein [Bacillota bacterium]